MPRLPFWKVRKWPSRPAGGLLARAQHFAPVALDAQFPFLGEGDELLDLRAVRVVARDARDAARVVGGPHPVLLAALVVALHAGGKRWHSGEGLSLKIRMASITFHPLVDMFLMIEGDGFVGFVVKTEVDEKE